MKHLLTHYRNKYPQGKVEVTESSFTVYDANGDLCVRLEKDGNGNTKDCSKEWGAKDFHDLSPIPKNARAHKHFVDGVHGKAEEHAERVQWQKEHAVDGKVLSIKEYEKLGYEFDEKGRHLKADKKA